MSDNSEIENESRNGCDEPANAESQVLSRRKFIKGAAATTPIIMSVASRPVWARNCALSGQLSGNLSDPTPCEGEGCGASFWGLAGNEYLYHRDFPAYMPFNSAFGRNAFEGHSLMEVVQKNVDRRNITIPYNCTDGRRRCKLALLELGCQAVAAMQNSASPIRYDLDLDLVIRSFQESFDAGSEAAMLETAAAFQQLNEQICPL